MIRKWALLFLPIFCCFALSCKGFDQEVIDEPPAKAKELARWWQEKIDNMPLPLLAVYAEASEAHRRGGTAATYVDFFQGRTMVGWYRSTSRLPCPPPEHAFARMRQRLKDHQSEITASLDESAADQFDWDRAEDCRACTPEHAKAIWEGARAKVFSKEKE